MSMWANLLVNIVGEGGEMRRRSLVYVSSINQMKLPVDKLLRKDEE